MTQNFPSDIIAVQWKKNADEFFEHGKAYVSKGTFFWFLTVWLSNMDRVRRTDRIWNLF